MYPELSSNSLRFPDLRLVLGGPIRRDTQNGDREKSLGQGGQLWSVPQSDAATKQWISQWMHNKTDSVPGKFLFLGNNYYYENVKNMRYIGNFIFYHRAVGEQDHYMTHLLIYESAIL